MSATNITNLWEAFVLYARNDAGFMRKLDDSACLSWQEIGIQPSEEGWIIFITACNEDGRVEILIPKDRNEPIKILKDTRKESKRYNLG